MDARYHAALLIVILTLDLVPVAGIATEAPIFRIIERSRSAVLLGGSDVVVNEAYPDPDSDANDDGTVDQRDEFIELFNAGPATVDLTGWSLGDNGGTYILGTMIGPGSHIVMGRTLTGLVLGSDENVTLKNGNGDVIDVLGWINARKGYSIFRSPDGSERIREKKAPTPGSPNPIPPSIVINEVMPDPEGANSGMQWMEIINAGDREDLIGSRITNSETMDLYLPSLTMDGGERALICIGTDNGLGVHPPEVRILELDSDKTLFVNGDDLQFIDPDGYLTDFVAWGNSSHVDPPLDILDRIQWTGKLWDPENGTMTQTGTDNPVPRSGSSLMRIGDGKDTGSPGDFASGTGFMRSTPGWSNDLDPTVDTEMIGVREFAISEGKQLALVFSPRSPASDVISVNISVSDGRWALTGGGERTVNVSGTDPIEIELGLLAPPDLCNHTTELRAEAFWIGFEWFRTNFVSTLLIPSFDLAPEETYLILDGDRVTSLPEGSEAMIKGYVRNNGEIPTPETGISLTVGSENGDRLLLERTILSIKAGQRRSFSFEIDTLHWSGKVSLAVTADPDSLASEFNETNNVWAANATVIPTPVLRGEQGLAIDRVLFNATSDMRYATIFNPASEAVAIGGMRLGDLGGYFIFPEEASIGPNQSIGVAWGEGSMDRLPAGIVVFRGDGEGAKSRQMDRSGRIPDPMAYGALSLESRYRKSIDILLIGNEHQGIFGWVDVSGSIVRATHGTEVRRMRDPRGSPLDSNSSLDWTCCSGDASLFAFCPSPDPSLSSEFAAILFEGDPSGFMLECGGRCAVVPNGTASEVGLPFVVAKDAEKFRESQGNIPDALFGDPEDKLPGMRVPGWGSFVLPDGEGNLSLYDPSCRLLDSVEWGDGGIGEVKQDSAYLKVDEVEGDRSSWAFCGKASVDMGLELMATGIDGCNITTFADIEAALEWVSVPGRMTVRTDLPYNTLVMAMADVTGERELYLDIPPWNDIPGYGGEMALREERIAAALYLSEDGVTIRHPVTPSSGSGTFVSCGGRLVFASGFCHDERSFAVGYELPDQAIADDLTAALLGRGSDWRDSEEVLRSHEQDVREFIPLESLTNGAKTASITGRMEVLPGPKLPEVAASMDLTIVDTNGILDLASILNKADAGTRVRLIVSPEPHPVRDTDDSEYLRFCDLADCRGPDTSPYDDDPFVRAVAAQRLARERGIGLEIRMASHSLSPSLTGSILGPGLMYSSIGGRSGPGNAFWMGSEVGSEDTLEYAEGVWSSSLCLPEGLIGTGADGPEESGHGPMLIEEVYFDTYVQEDPDEYVALYNPGGSPVELEGWTLSDDEGIPFHNDGTILFLGGTISPGGSIFIARNGTSFAVQNGFEPNLSWESPISSPLPFRLIGSPVLTNGNDSVCLRDPEGRIVDLVPFGRCLWNETPWRRVEGGGWSGPAAPDPGWGHVLYRSHGWSGRCPDTDTTGDWLTLRPRYPGQSRFSPFEPAEGVTADVGICPDTSSELLMDIIGSAQRELSVNVYELWSDWIANALVGASERGVIVRVILEGGPVSGISESGTRCISTLTSSGIEVRLMWNEAGSNSRDRYRYDHAKYIVADGTTVLVSSDNFKDTSFPPPNYLPASGSRGWVVTVRSEEIAGNLLTVFENDWRGLDMKRPEEVIDLPDPSSSPSYGVDLLPVDHLDTSQSPTTDLMCDSAMIMVSPDHLGVIDNPLVKAILGAEEEVLCELLDLSPAFELRTMEPAVYPPIAAGSALYPGSIAANPYLDALFRAAARGSRVRILLDGTDFDSDTEPDNLPAAEWVRSEAARRGLNGSIKVELMPSEVPIGPACVGLVHNKGVVVDGRTSWVSSLNWGPTSALENREAGLLIQSEDVSSALRKAFMLDWGLTLHDEVSLRKEGMTVERWNGSAVRIRLSVTPTKVPDGPIFLHVGFDSLNEAIEGDSLEWSQVSEGNTTILEYVGPLCSGVKLSLLANDGERICLLMTLNVSGPASEEDGGWGSPFYKDPLFPLVLMIAIPVLISVPLAMYRARKRFATGREE